MMSDSATYLSELTATLTNYYHKLDGRGSADPIDKAYLDGFVRAGMISGAASLVEIQTVIDSTHIDVFGMSIAERRHARALAGDDHKAWDVYESPAWKRKK